MAIKTVTISEDGLSYNITEDGNIRRNITISEESHLERFGIREWLDAGNTPAPYVGPTAMETWVEDMARSDTALLSRAMEDMLNGMPDKSSVAQITLDRLQSKKDLRGERP
jgi:hypothetical protein